MWYEASKESIEHNFNIIENQYFFILVLGEGFYSTSEESEVSFLVKTLSQ